MTVTSFHWFETRISFEYTNAEMNSMGLKTYGTDLKRHNGEWGVFAL